MVHTATGGKCVNKELSTCVLSAVEESIGCSESICQGDLTQSGKLPPRKWRVGRSDPAKEGRKGGGAGRPCLEAAWPVRETKRLGWLQCSK